MRLVCVPTLGHSTTAVVENATAMQTIAYQLFGGDSESGETTFDTVYEVRWNEDSFTPALTYTEITAAGDAPLSRMFHLAAYDQPGHRILVYGGSRGGQLLADLWELRLPDP